MDQRALRAVFMRGGTSKAVMFHRSDLPAEQSAWDAIFLAVMGSPDPYGRQLDGMGGGISSLSKICVVGPSSHPAADVDFTFAQVAVDKALVDYAGNCGNMSSAIGPFAVDERLVAVPQDGETSVRIHNTNTGKIIVSHFGVHDGRAAVVGDLALDGVSGRGAPIRLDFLDLEGAKTGRLLPTGSPVNRLTLSDGSQFEASLVDAANPSVFVRASDFGLSGAELPEELERRTDLLARLEELRCRASLCMGMADDLAAAAAQASQPKIALLAAPADMRTLSDGPLAASEVDILARMLSMGRPHRAIPITGALCLAAACRVPGSLAADLVRQRPAGEERIRIGQPSGVTVVAAETLLSGNEIVIPRATIYRTARRLFQGEVLYCPPREAQAV